jgi:translation elongation factor EF-1beta
MSWFGMKGLKVEVEVRGDEGIRDERRERIRKRTR